MKVVFLNNIGCISHSANAILLVRRGYQSHETPQTDRLVSANDKPELWDKPGSEHALSVPHVTFVCQTQPGDGSGHLSIICAVFLAEVIPHMTFLFYFYFVKALSVWWFSLLMMCWEWIIWVPDVACTWCNAQACIINFKNGHLRTIH